MNCETFRERVCVDPADADAALLVHESACLPCAAYAKRARRAEALIDQALRFDTLKVAAQSAQRPMAFASIAAAVVAGLAFWFGLAVDRPASTEYLATGILEHMDHEPEAVTFATASVPERALSQVLAGEATIDLATLAAEIGLVTYANKCAVAGQWMSHLVVQSGNGPVTVLIIPEQSVSGFVPLEHSELRLGGSIMPAGQGSIAVLGEDDTANARIARRIAESVDISI